MGGRLADRRRVGKWKFADFGVGALIAANQTQATESRRRSLPDTDPHWMPLTFDRMPNELQASFCSEFPNGEELRNWVVGEFESQTGSQFQPATWSDHDVAKFRRWWWFQHANGDFTARRRPKLQNMMHLSLGSKVNVLAQRHCEICCGLLPSELQFPISVMPVRIAPESRQSLGSVNWAAFQSAVRAWFANRVLDIGSSRHLCIAITFVLSTERRDRDLDNMTKALMDAFARAIGFDDREIHHLDVAKVIGETTEEYVYIRTAPSYLQDQSTVMLPIFDGNFAVGEPLSLEDFV